MKHLKVFKVFSNVSMTHNHPWKIQSYRILSNLMLKGVFVKLQALRILSMNVVSTWWPVQTWKTEDGRWNLCRESVYLFGCIFLSLWGLQAIIVCFGEWRQSENCKLRHCAQSSAAAAPKYSKPAHFSDISLHHEWSGLVAHKSNQGCLCKNYWWHTNRKCT